MMVINNKKVMCWGSKSQALLYQNYLSNQNIRLDFIYDPTTSERPSWFSLNFGFDRNFFNTAASQSSYFIVAIGSYFGYQRSQISIFLRRYFNLLSLPIIHPTSFMCTSSRCGAGIVQMPFSVINSFTSVGDDCIFNSNSTVDHECEIGHGVHVMGAAAIAGRVKVGSYSSIGTNSTVLPDLTIGSRVIVGAGSVVTKSLPDNVVVYGNPARIIASSDEYLKFPFSHIDRYPRNIIDLLF